MQQNFPPSSGGTPSALPPPEEFLYLTESGIDEVRKLLVQWKESKGWSVREIAEYLAERLTLPPDMTPPQHSGIGSFLNGRTRIPDINTLRMYWQAGAFGDRPLQVVEAIACGMPVAEAEALPGKP